MRVVFTLGQIHRHTINGIYLDRDTIPVVEAESLGEAYDAFYEATKGVFHDYMLEEYFDEKGLIKYFPKGKVFIGTVVNGEIVWK